MRILLEPRRRVLATTGFALDRALPCRPLQPAPLQTIQRMYHVAAVKHGQEVVNSLVRIARSRLEVFAKDAPGILDRP